uniref:PGG domain-containing protein n=1 Tax=Panagrellus redivivus TaxID=6233 RepID=A0A7E4ZTE1_PANRE
MLIPHFSFKLTMPLPDVFDQLYITDDEAVYYWATNKVYWFQTLKYLYWLIRWMLDGASFKPTWHSVLTVEQIVKEKQLIYVSDTLVVNCQSIEAFEELIPFLMGSYTRLMIHGGSISLGQLRRLMKDTVRKVEITAKIELKSDEYGNAVQLIMRHVHKTGDNFHLMSTPQLITKVKSAVKGYEDLRLFASDDEPKKCNVVHWKMEWIAGVSYAVGLCYLMATLREPIAYILGLPSLSVPSSPIANTIDFALNCVLWALHILLFVFSILRNTFESKPKK